MRQGPLGVKARCARKVLPSPHDPDAKGLEAPLTIDEAIAAARAFRDERDWAQFHNPKDLAIAVSVEAGELLQCFQWSGQDLCALDKKPELCDELADVMIYCAYLADALGVDAGDVMGRKIAKNALKYPVEKAKGNSKKYTEL